MKIDGVVKLPAAPPAVWGLLTDPGSLARLLPGCQRLDPDGPDRYKAVVKFGIAAISGSYAGSVEFSRKKPPHSLSLTLDGKGLPGFVHAEGSLSLAAQGAQTEVRYSGEAQVGGMIASRWSSECSKRLRAGSCSSFSKPLQLSCKPLQRRLARRTRPASRLPRNRRRARGNERRG